MRVATSSFKLKLTDAGYSPGEYLYTQAWRYLWWAGLCWALSSMFLLGTVAVLFLLEVLTVRRRMRDWRDAPEIRVEFVKNEVAA